MYVYRIHGSTYSRNVHVITGVGSGDLQRKKVSHSVGGISIIFLVITTRGRSLCKRLNARGILQSLSLIHIQMCIRDRSLNGQNFVELDGHFCRICSHFRFVSTIFPYILIDNSTITVTRQIIQDICISAVSYTHLDVYKRQALK